MDQNQRGPGTVDHNHHNDNRNITDSCNTTKNDNKNSYNTNNSGSHNLTINYRSSPVSPNPPQSSSSSPRKEHLKAHELYAHRLYPKGHGYPLWTPEPNGPPEYHNDGIKVGDVGYITQNGGFEVLFNITLPEDHNINQWFKLGPGNFEQLELDDQAGYSKTENQIPRGECIYSGGPIDTYSFQVPPCRSEGAALILPQGASRTDYKKAGSLCKHVAPHVKTWYHYFDEQGYSDIQNGSLYIISGFFKTACYYAAV
ncbi:hypothetical protein K435DRAFT_755436, partial [Dendrothele bispora CBS 962.96]